MKDEDVIEEVLFAGSKTGKASAAPRRVGARVTRRLIPGLPTRRGNRIVRPNRTVTLPAGVKFGGVVRKNAAGKLVRR